ncbi:MAG: hypothetical protein ACOH2N_19875 [Devosia sp.]
MALNATCLRLIQASLTLWRRRWLRRAIMVVLIVASLVFLFLAVREASTRDILQAASGQDFAIVGLAGIGYALLLALLARSWTLPLGTQTRGLGYRLAIAVYGPSILPKYIPGSVLQYGSRQYLGRRLGWSAILMAKATLLEITLHVMCSLIVALALLTQRAEGGAAYGAYGYVMVIALAIILAVAALFFVSRSVTPKIIVASVVYQTVFFAGLASLAMLCGAVFGVATDHLFTVGGLFLLSWLIGFAVPLVPGGIGVREASGVAMLSGLVGLEAALLILAAMRIISLIGDMAIFLAGLACQRSLRLAHV